MQNSNLKCADARHFIHLTVGDDTLAEEERKLADHLHSCSDCRAYHAGMVDVMHAIERVRDNNAVATPTASLWPAMADQLRSRRSQPVRPERRRFNGAVVALCACSLMLAMVTAVQNLPTNSADPYASFGTNPAAATPVSFYGQQPQNPQQPQLVRVPGPDGSFVLFDPVSGRYFVPQTAPASQVPQDSNLQF